VSTTHTTENDVRALTDALYADGDLGPGYMLREDCEYLARRVLATGIVRVDLCDHLYPPANSDGTCPSCGKPRVIPPGSGDES
jgi:hypothetical protein